MRDVVDDNPHLFLGSRFKRLGERMQADVLRVVERAGLPIQPAQYPFLSALDRYGALSVNDLAAATGVSQPGATRSLARLTEMGLVDTQQPDHDRRRTVAALTEAGREAVARSKREVWPQVEGAVRALCDEINAPLMQALDALEAALDREPLHQRVRDTVAGDLRIREFSDALAPVFHDINAQWIRAMFALEPTDREVLENPRDRIVDPGGDILFVEADGLGVVGTCALQKTGPNQFELTKMGVLESARGMKAGEFLLHAMIERAADLGAERLYLLTNAKCASAIHLYEKAGFQHDAGIMAEFGARYERCNVAMLYRGPLLASSEAGA
ncbi:MAG: GNAT family N-acetyltransferase [Brevundimonas sp.]|nr:MAG: GNAT family N-acetyltransferase [Brevundimonas sp.]